MKPKIKQTESTSSDFFELRRDLLENKDGILSTYTSLLLPSAVVILAQTKEGLWVVNREYRHPTGEVLLGPPGGRLEKGENPVVGGQRELFEETGYWSDEIVVAGSCHPFPGLSDQRIYYLWAKNAEKKAEQKLEPFELIQVELMSDQQLRQELKQGNHIDGNLCIALWYKDHFC